MRTDDKIGEEIKKRETWMPSSRMYKPYFKAEVYSVMSEFSSVSESFSVSHIEFSPTIKKLLGFTSFWHCREHMPLCRQSNFQINKLAHIQIHHKTYSGGTCNYWSNVNKSTNKYFKNPYTFFFCLCSDFYWRWNCYKI